jgi:cytochrome P450
MWLGTLNIVATVATCIILQILARLFQQRGVFAAIPGPPFRIFSQRGEIFHSIDLPRQLATKYGSMWKVWTSFWTAEVVVSEPELVDVILNNTHDFEIGDRSRMRILTGDSLLTLRGPKWKAERKILNPAFHAAKLQCMSVIIEKATTKLLIKCKRLAQAKEPVEIGNLFRMLTLEIICQAAFGIDIDCQNKSTHPLACLFAKLFDNRQSYDTYLSQARAFVTGEMSKRLKLVKDIRVEVGRLVTLRQTQILTADSQEEKDLLYSKDLLGLLLAKKEEGALVEKRVVDEAMAFMIAGHETTSTWLMWTIYMLSQAPVVQGLLDEELNRVIGEHAPTWDLIKQCEYLSCVLKESLRMYPPVPFLLRRATRNLKLGQYFIPQNTMLNVAPILLHTNPTVWEDPDTVKPNRFESKCPDGTFIPFSDGGRNCIGQYFATMEAKIIAARVLKDFKFTLVPGQNLTKVAGVVLFVADGIKMHIEVR